ncbi:cysteine hydrolase family protein [Paenibacillus hodogayensis]|uniref:Cysteine hydrolase family protein n=1 Tax=Paenibacillus hodogayensis TaxID=279208 RepID=A0ABV5VWF8_9BACL
MSSYTRPNWRTSALVTIDTQNDFTLPGAPAEIQGTSAALPNMERVLNAYRAQGLPVLHVIRLYMEDGSNVDLCRREAVENGARIAAPGTEGAELADAIRAAGYAPLDADKLLNGGFQEVGEREWAMYKPRWGAFYRTGLETFLRERGIDTLVFIGCNFPNCPRTSIYEASERDFRVVLVADAMSQVYEKGIQEVSGIGVYVCGTEQVLHTVAEHDTTMLADAPENGTRNGIGPEGVE